MDDVKNMDRSNEAVTSIGRDAMQNGARRQSRAVASSFLKGLDLMTVLARRPEGIPITMLVRKLNQPRTSVLRMLTTLEHYGLAARDGRAWCATELFYQWRSRETHQEIKQRYSRSLQAIADEVDELVGVGIGEARGVRYIHCARGSQPGVLQPPSSEVYPLHRTATGKLVLTQRPDLMDPGANCRLQAEIEEARTSGIAWARRECTPFDIAFAVWGAVPSAITPIVFVAWPFFRFTEEKAARALAIVRRELTLLAR